MTDLEMFKQWLQKVGCEYHIDDDYMINHVGVVIEASGEVDAVFTSEGKFVRFYGNAWGKYD